MTNETKAPQVLSSRKIFQGHTIDVSIDTVREHDKVYVREVVRHSGSVVILPAHDDGTIVLVRQYRHPAVRYLLEAPAGTLSHGERPEEGAARELAEETGLIASQLEKLSEFFVSPGFCEEKMWLYLATGLSDTTQQLEEDEMIEVVRLPVDRALQMITDGEIEDAKTIIGLMLAAPRLGAATLEPSYPSV